MVHLGAGEQDRWIDKHSGKIRLVSLCSLLVLMPAWPSCESRVSSGAKLPSLIDVKSPDRWSTFP